MEIKRQNKTIKLYHLSWSDYCQLVKQLKQILDTLEPVGAGQRVMYLVLVRLQRRLAKGDHYPLNDHYLTPHFGKKFIVNLEPEEALALHALYPPTPGDPVRSFINLNFPRFF